MKKYPSHVVVHPEDWQWKPWISWICEARGRTEPKQKQALALAYRDLGSIAVPQPNPPKDHEVDKVRRWFESVWQRNNVDFKSS